MELERKAFEVARLQKIVFGDRRERIDPEALVLPGVDLAPSNDTTPEEPVAKRRVKAHERDVVSRRRRARLALDPACVTEEHVYLDPERTTCACCGAALAVIGEERREVTEREPARYLRVVTHRRKMACVGCKQGGVQIAPAAEPPATGAGGVGASLAVDIAVMHYADHLPFHRMAGIFLREGLTIDRSTLSRVAGRVSDALRPVVDRMERELLGSDAVLGIDGTGVKILARPHCARRTVYVRHGAGHVVYRALRAADAPSVLEGMEGFGGVVVGDAATVHTGTVAASMRIDLALCNAHARRGFYDARGTDRARADVALAFYREVAIEERRTAALDPLARRGERERVLGPRFERFHAWLVEERPKLGPRSPMAEAFDYALRHWKGLTRFLHDGRVPWTNNESERLLRHLVVGRKYAQLSDMRSGSPSQPCSQPRHFKGSAYSQPIEEGEQIVARSEARVALDGLCERGERTSLHLEVSLDVAVRRRGALVPEPQGDHREIDARLQQMHRRSPDYSRGFGRRRM